MPSSRHSPNEIQCFTIHLPFSCNTYMKAVLAGDPRRVVPWDSTLGLSIPVIEYNDVLSGSNVIWVTSQSRGICFDFSAKFCLYHSIFRFIRTTEIPMDLVVS
jgi:hypothetical protein